MEHDKGDDPTMGVSLMRIQIVEYIQVANSTRDFLTSSRRNPGHTRRKKRAHAHNNILIAHRKQETLIDWRRDNSHIYCHVIGIRINGKRADT
jgi:hypothetical protein